MCQLVEHLKWCDGDRRNHALRHRCWKRVGRNKLLQHTIPLTKPDPHMLTSTHLQSREGSRAGPLLSTTAPSRMRAEESCSTQYSPHPAHKRPHRTTHSQPPEDSRAGPLPSPTSPSSTSSVRAEESCSTQHSPHPAHKCSYRITHSKSPEGSRAGPLLSTTAPSSVRAETSCSTHTKP